MNTGTIDITGIIRRTVSVILLAAIFGLGPAYFCFADSLPSTQIMDQAGDGHDFGNAPMNNAELPSASDFAVALDQQIYMPLGSEIVFRDPGPVNQAQSANDAPAMSELGLNSPQCNLNSASEHTELAMNCTGGIY